MPPRSAPPLAPPPAAEPRHHRQAPAAGGAGQRRDGLNLRQAWNNGGPAGSDPPRLSSRFGTGPMDSSMRSAYCDPGRRDVLGRRLARQLDDLLELVHGARPREDGLAAEHLAQDAAHGPHVDALGVDGTPSKISGARYHLVAT